ncbi:MAG: LVIVD repeat-containing protein [Actinomycetota bacterium]
MARVSRLLTAIALVAGASAVSGTAGADHATREHTGNIHAKGHSVHAATFLGAPDGARHISSDLAFRGNIAFQGNFDGFRVIDVADPDNPVEIVHQGCNGDQGDIVVHGDILVRSWNSKKATARLCDGETVPAGWEGVHVFDVSNLADPDLVASVALPCGSHTATAAGVSAGQLIVYSNNSSSAGCVNGTQANDDPVGDFMDVISVPLANPAGATLLRREPLAGPATGVRTGCHDAGVILGDVNKAVCASADTINVFDIGANATPGGSPEDPAFLYSISEPGVGQAGTNGRWHSAAFTWDGEVIAAGWEPGGGVEPECEGSDPAVDKSMFFYDADTGAKLGQWVLPRAQSATENCTVHNYNVVPLRSGRYVAVGGHYQAGTWVVDFTDPANPATLAWSDPAPFGTVVTPAGAVVNEAAGAWSSYYYNNFVYESDITKGLHVFRVSDRAMAGAIRLPSSNPQTQDFSIG